MPIEKHRKYREFLESYVEFLEKMAEGESDKYKAMLSYDAKRVDRAVSNQQAMNMRLEQLERQREQEQQEAGLEGLTSQQILERLEGTERESFRELFRRFERAVNDVRYFNGKSLAFAQEGIKMLGVLDSPAKAPYKADGKRPEGAQSASLFETKI